MGASVVLGSSPGTPAQNSSDSAGRLPWLELGRHVRYDRDELLAWVREDRHGETTHLCRGMGAVHLTRLAAGYRVRAQARDDGQTPLVARRRRHRGGSASGMAGTDPRPRRTRGVRRRTGQIRYAHLLPHHRNARGARSGSHACVAPAGARERADHPRELCCQRRRGRPAHRGDPRRAASELNCKRGASRPFSNVQKISIFRRRRNQGII